MGLNLIYISFLLIFTSSCSFVAKITNLNSSSSSLDSPSGPSLPLQKNAIKILRTLPAGSNPNILTGNNNAFSYDAEEIAGEPNNYFFDGSMILKTSTVSTALPTDSSYRGTIGTKRYFYSASDSAMWTTDLNFSGAQRLATCFDMLYNGSIYALDLNEINSGGAGAIWINNDAIYQTDGTTSGTVITELTTTGGWLSSIYGILPTGVVLSVSNYSSVYYGIYFYKFSDQSLTLLTDIDSLGYDGGRGGQATYNGKVYFTLHKGGIGNYLWVSDGTSAGTFEVQNITMMDGTIQPLGGIGTSMIYIAQPTSAGGGTFRVYSTQGTSPGSWTLLKDMGLSFMPPNSYIYELDFKIKFGSKIVFRISEGYRKNLDAFNEIWETDGSASGTAKIANIAANDSSANVYAYSYLNPFIFNNVLYFQGYSAATGIELWKYDGIASPTLFIDLATGDSSGLFLPLASYAEKVSASITTSYFLIPYNFTNEGIEFLKSDGTVSGTKLLKDVFPGKGASIDESAKRIVIGDKVYFSANDRTHGSELWETDGTSAGTKPTQLLNQNVGDAEISNQLISTDNFIYFTMNDGAHGNEPWISDGTADGTNLMADLQVGYRSSFITGFTKLGTSIYFVANNNPNPFEYSSFFKFDEVTKNLVEISNKNTISNFQPVAGTSKVFFVGYDSTNGMEPWAYDTTNSSLYSLNIRPGSTGSLDWSINFMATLADNLLFGPTRTNASFPAEPMISNGSAGNSSVLANFNPANNGSYPVFSYTVNNHVFFVVVAQTYGNEIAVTDATPGNTKIIKDINPAGNSVSIYSNPFLGKVGNNLLFKADNGTQGEELWVSDGTTAGTTLLKDLSPGVDNSKFGDFVELNGKTYFFVLPANNTNWELWSTDGTSAGTVKIKIFSEDTAQPTSLIGEKNSLFYSFCDSAHGCEIWKTNTLTGETQLFWDVIPGPTSSNARSFVKFKNHMYFIATEGQYEGLWATSFEAPPDN